MSPELPTSDVMFGCLDLLSTYEELSARGAVFPQPPVRQPFGWSMFSDTVGNRFALGQKEPASTPDVESTTAAPAYE